MEKIYYIEVILLAIFFGEIRGVPINNEDFTLRILHTNDMHARFEQTSALSTKCLEKAAKAGECYGGFARLATLIRQSRNSTELPAIFLNAGDTYQGTTWFTVHKWKIVAKFLNLLAPNAICLGNHEFDDGVIGLLPFLEKAEFPVLAANLDLTDEPKLAKSNLKKSVVLNIANKKIGVIGYLTPETKVIAQPGQVHFLDEIEAVRAEVKELQSQGVNILIALGHSGFLVDKKIAAEVDGIDLVIGGHTNTFLYTGKQPDIEVSEGFYPTEVIQKGGRKVYVVQAYAYTKYLGNLTVNFDANGEVRRIEGQPLLVDNSIKQAQDILDELEVWRPAIENLQLEIVGSSRVLLDGDAKNCRRGECNFGNMIADAMIDYNAREYGGSDGWTDAAISLHTSGTVRASIDREPDDTISMSDILAALPFNNGLGKLRLTGKILREALEWSVYDLDRNDTSHLKGAFMHFSGLQVDYDLSKPNGARVVSVYVRCAKCRIPDFSLLKNNESYTVLLPDFLSQGGDGYEMLKDLKFTPSGVTTDSVVADYIRRHSPVHPEVEWRINFVSDENEKIYERTNKNLTGGSGGSYQSITFSMMLITILLSLFG